MIPTRIRHFPNFLADQLWRRRTLSRDVRKRHFNLCYFTCESYFKYTYCSLHSLATFLPKIDYTVHIFNDSDSPMVREQIDILHKIAPSLNVVDWPKSMGWGTEQIQNIWRGYETVAASAAPHDVIARVDSDVFFFNDRVFQLLLRIDDEFIGDGHYTNFDYPQGGCYFLSVRAVEKILAHIASHDMDSLVANLPIDVEDVAVDRFAKAIDLKIRNTWFMGYPQEFENCGRYHSWFRRKFSCIHFVMKDKDKMVECYLANFIPKNKTSEFVQAIEGMSEKTS